MNDRLVMEIFVKIDFAAVSQLEGTAGSAIMIPFGGTVSGELFSGIVLPGGVDTQVVDVNGVRHMSARYMLDGRDQTGAQCRIYVENNGHFPKDEPMPFKTVPTFITDSTALAKYLHGHIFRGEGHPWEDGVVIKIFEIAQG